MCIHDLPDMYALEPVAQWLWHTYQANPHVTTITCNPV